MSAGAGGGLNDVRQKHPSVPSSNQPPVQEWANSFWYMIRIAALQASPALDDNTAAHIVNFMASMAAVIPCPDCRRDFAKDWAEDPFTMAHAKSADQAMFWVEDLRRKVERHVEEQRRAKGLSVPHGAVSLLPPPMASAPAPAPAAAPAPAPAQATHEQAQPIAQSPNVILRNPATTATASAGSRLLASAMNPRRRRQLGGPLLYRAALARAGAGAGVGVSAGAGVGVGASAGAGVGVSAGAGAGSSSSSSSISEPKIYSGRASGVAEATMADDGTHPPGKPNPAAAMLRTWALRSALQATEANLAGRRMHCNCPTKKK
jgi:hypothetical protein